MTIKEIEKLTEKLSKARAELSSIITRLQLKQNALLNEQLPAIGKIIGNTADHTGEIIVGIEACHYLFVSPKSLILNGIKFGLRKGVGGITWDDEQDVIKRAEKRFTAEQCELLIKTEKTLRKKAVASLDGADIKAIGCKIEETGDVAFVKPVDTSVDKIVNAMFKKALDEAQKEAA